MKVIGRSAVPTGDVLADGIANVLSAFPGSEVLDPATAQAVVEGPAVSTVQIEKSETKARAEKVREYREVHAAALALAQRREQVANEIGAKIDKRTYFVMQCRRCEGFFIGTSGAKGWSYPSGRKGACSVCAAGLTAKGKAAMNDEATVVTEVVGS